MVLLSQTSSSTLNSYWEPEVKAGEKRLIHPCNPLRAPRATALGFPDPKLISLVALGGLFFLEFLELVPDPVPAFHLSWQFPVASVLLSSWDGQMAWRAVHSKVWLLTAGSASLQVRDQDWEHLHGAEDHKDLFKLGKNSSGLSIGLAGMSRKRCLGCENSFFGKW